MMTFALFFTYVCAAVLAMFLGAWIEATIGFDDLVFGVYIVSVLGSLIALPLCFVLACRLARRWFPIVNPPAV